MMNLYPLVIRSRRAQTAFAYLQRDNPNGDIWPLATEPRETNNRCRGQDGADCTIPVTYTRGEEAIAARNGIERKSLLRVLLIAFSLVLFSQAQVPTASNVVIVLEENSNYSNVVSSSSMPYLNSLINRYGLAAQYYANTHPSIGNYFMLTTGQILTNDDSQTPSSFSVSVDNVVRELLTAGKTWKGYGEGLPSVGYTGGDWSFNGCTGYVRHFPLAYLTDVQNRAAQKLNLV